MVIDLVSKFIEETRGHPLNVTAPEAQVLHDFALWIDAHTAEKGVQSDETICSCTHDKYDNPNNPGYCMACGKPFRRQLKPYLGAGG